MADTSRNDIETLFAEALHRPSGEREAFLEERCESEVLRQEIFSLLAAYEEGEGFFEDFAAAAASIRSDPQGRREEGPPGALSDPLELTEGRVGRYRVEEYLGGGSMGMVYKARDTELARPVALKFLPPHLSWREEADRRFLREARSAAALDHSSVATIHEIGTTEDGRRFIAMAYYEGETLKEKLAREGPLSMEEAVSYAMQIAEGLVRAHEAGIVHRDVKPANVMVTERGEVKLVDFGIAKLKDGERITETGDTIGTVAYMGPEQIQGKEVDRRADLFSLGVVFYEMLTGQHPFLEENRQAVAYQIIHEEAKPPSSYREELPARLDEVVLRCLQKRPEERYGSAEEVLSALQKAMPKVGLSSPRVESSASEAGSHLLDHSRLKRRPMVGLGVLTVVVALFMGWWLLGGSVSEEVREVVPGGTEPRITDRSVAVLPFDALGQDEPSSVTEGIHDDLLTRLSNIGDLQVTSRTSVERYRVTKLSLPAVAESLGVRWIVEGGVQEAGGLVQVNAQLIDPETDAYVWADRYQRELTAEDLFAIQEDIAAEIAAALEAELTAGERERIAGAPTEDLEAYRLYVQGRQRLAQFAFSRLQILAEVVPYFRRAIERDSSFARAWAGLADAAAYVDFYETYHDWPDTLHAPGIDEEGAARRALQLDPDLAEARASMGFIRLVNGEAPEAADQLRQAVDLKPSYWQAHHWLGYLYLSIGRAEAAVDHLELALELNPEHALGRHGLYGAYLAAGEAEKSLDEARLQQRLGLEREAAVGGEVRALYHLGRLEEARRIAQEQIADLGLETSWGAWFRVYLVGIHAAAGDTDRARRHLDQLRNAEVSTPAMVAWAYAALGNADRAFETYRRLDERDWRRAGASAQIRYGIGTDGELLRADPRYEELLREANRAWGLEPDESILAERSAASGPDR